MKATFDWKHPDYSSVWRLRMDNVKRLEDMSASKFETLKNFYRINPDQFIDDWGVTFDPRNADVGLPTLIPMVMFPKQRELVQYVMRKWRGRSPGLIEKSRDVGATWIIIGLSCTLCILYEGIAIGIASRKTEYVDKIGTLKPILPKARMFMEHLPPQFRGTWVAWRDAPYMRISFPDTGSLIGGEGGDNIGRGDRTTIHFVDEAAHLDRPELVDASLSMTTNCRIDLSSVRGMNNPFARKRWEGKIEPFIFDWHDDPRKDDAWYESLTTEQNLDPVVIAQEVDRDYQASVTGVVIPAAWARACLGAKEKLGIAPAGNRSVSLDIADEGRDKNAACLREGTQVEGVEEWSGKGGDIFATVERAFEICDEFGTQSFRYDADGLGAGARGDARIVNERRKEARARPVAAIGFRGSEGPYDPDGVVEGTLGASPGDKGRTNQDYFANRKAQGWWELRRRARNTFRWVVEGRPCAPDEILSINPKGANAMRLVAEMSQATYRTNNVGKIVIDKMPDNMKSPNLADAVMIDLAPSDRGPTRITQGMLAEIATAAARARMARR